MTRARPLRFLVLLLGLWIGARIYMLVRPDAPQPSGPSGTTAGTMPAAPIQRSAAPRRVVRRLVRGRTARRWLRGLSRSTGRLRAGLRAASMQLSELSAGPPPSPPPPPPMAEPPSRSGYRLLGPDLSEIAVTGARMLTLTEAASSRWSGSAWLLLRDGRSQAALAPGGTLGGSQVGARLLYRLGDGVSLSGRAYLPLRRTAGAEVAAGIDWQPSFRVPIHLLAERRQDVGGAGRSAFALTIYGGTSGRLPGGLRGEAYAQAGVVGTRSRDLFVDASARASLPIGRFEVGASAWGAAQPGAVRLDAGPHISYRLPVRDANIRLQADWRFRIGGDAAPGSGPALSLAVDF